MARGKKKESALTPEEKLAQALIPVEEQPYKVPENWRWVLFNNISNIRTGKKDANYGNECGQYPFFTCAADPIRCDGYSFDCNAILLAGNGDINNISRYEGKFEAYQRTYVVEIQPPIDTDLLFYYFKYRWFDYNKDKMFGTAIPYIRLGNLQTFPIPLPPLAEQQRIVDRIEYLFDKLDEAKEKAQSVLDSFEIRKAAILHKAFTGELTAKWRAGHGVVKSTWATKKVGEFAEVKGGKRLPKGHVLTTEKTDHPYLRIADFGEGTIDQSDLHYITNETYAEISRYIITSEDVYLSIVGSIGKTGVIPKELDGANLTENAARIISQCTLPKYLCAYLSSPTTQDDIQGRIRSATLGKLSLLNIKDISAPIPTKEEQAEIVRILDSLFAKEQQAKEAAEAVLEKIDLPKKSILARAFRGELGTNAPTEESAVELLKEIQKGD